MKSESGEESREYGVFSTVLIVVAVLAGIFLIWVGQMVVIWLEFESAEDAYKIFTTLTSLGGMISGGALIGGGIINKSIDKFVRLGMLVAAALIIVQVMSLGALSGLWSSLLGGLLG